MELDVGLCTRYSFLKLYFVYHHFPLSCFEYFQRCYFSLFYEAYEGAKSTLVSIK